GGAMRRAKSPAGDSTLMTSAPPSPSCIVQKGPHSPCVKSMTLKLSRLPVVVISMHRHCDRRRSRVLQAPRQYARPERHPHELAPLACARTSTADHRHACVPSAECQFRPGGRLRGPADDVATRQTGGMAHWEPSPCSSVRSTMPPVLS